MSRSEAENKEKEVRKLLPHILAHYNNIPFSIFKSLRWIKESICLEWERENTLKWSHVQSIPYKVVAFCSYSNKFYLSYMRTMLYVCCGVKNSIFCFAQSQNIHPSIHNNNNQFPPLYFLIHSCSIAQGQCCLSDFVRSPTVKKSGSKAL